MALQGVESIKNQLLPGITAHPAPAAGGSTRAGHINLPGRVDFGPLAFIGLHRLGKGWVGRCALRAERLQAQMLRHIEDPLPAYGDRVLGGAWDERRPAIPARSAWS